MICTIRKGEKKDLPCVLELVRELALFEKAPEAVTNTIEKMEEDGFGEKKIFSFLVAIVDEIIVGAAIYFIKYSTWKGKGLYLDDLIVTEPMRGKGIGSKLFDAFLDTAKSENAQQVHWQVLDWNKPAIDFYKKLGAKIEAEWLDCKLNAGQNKQFKQDSEEK